MWAGGRRPALDGGPGWWRRVGGRCWEWEEAWRGVPPRACMERARSSSVEEEVEREVSVSDVAVSREPVERGESAQESCAGVRCWVGELTSTRAKREPFQLLNQSLRLRPIRERSQDLRNGQSRSAWRRQPYACDGDVQHGRREAKLTLSSASTYIRSAVSYGRPLRLFQASLRVRAGAREASARGAGQPRRSRTRA